MSRQEPDLKPPAPPAGWYPQGDAVGWWDGSVWRDPVASTPSAKHRGLWIGLAVAAAGVVMFFGSLVGYAYLSGQAHDERSLDDATIRTVAARECSALAAALQKATGTRVERIDTGNIAISGLVAAMNELDSEKLHDDLPAIDWIADWQRLVVARSEFRTLLVDTPTSRFVVPLTNDGYPISGRMSDVAPEECSEAVDLATAP